MQQVGALQVADIFAAPAQKTHVLDTFDVRADNSIAASHAFIGSGYFFSAFLTKLWSTIAAASRSFTLGLLGAKESMFACTCAASGITP